MDAKSSYFTVKQSTEGLFKDRGSKFMAYLFPVTNDDEIKQHLSALRREHPSARHHCYAWRLIADGRVTSRASDDGEPSNTAGKPILTQLEANKLEQVLLVVIRYFGGTLLGVNGLINAYKNAAANAIANAAIIQHFVENEYAVQFDAGDQGAVMRLLKETGARIISNNYTTKQELVFRVKKQDSEMLEKKFIELYRTTMAFIKTI